MTKFPALAAALALAVFSGPLSATERFDGERLEYAFFWNGIRVGVGALEVERASVPALALDGHRLRDHGDVLRARVKIKSGGIGRTLYKTTSSFDSYLSHDLSKSLYFRKSERNKGETSQSEVVFDWNLGAAQYGRERGRRMPVDVVPGTFDLVGVLMAIRQNPPVEGEERKVPVTTGKRVGEVTAKHVRREVTKTESGDVLEMTVLHIKATMPADDERGYEAETPLSMLVWISEDGRRLPLKAELGSSYGDFAARLTKVGKVEE